LKEWGAKSKESKQKTTARVQTDVERVIEGEDTKHKAALRSETYAECERPEPQEVRRMMMMKGVQSTSRSDDNGEDGFEGRWAAEQEGRRVRKAGYESLF
jgi:hypothetical protein